MTNLLHTFPEEDGFTQGIRRAGLDYLVSSRAAMAALAENDFGLPYE
jgi:p-hydroxybenzoate 3-monooxygenase